jgi:septal ring factor EnvC (AmiA/AmiB activator)
MKKSILIIAAAISLMTSCKTPNPKEDEAVIRQRDSLLAVIDERESSVNEFMESFNEVERNLDSVSAHQHIISMSSDKDLKANHKDRMNAQIKAINDLMEANKKKLKQLGSKLNKADKRNAQLEKTIAMLNDQLNQKYTELNDLNERLNGLNIQVAQLQTSVEDLTTQNTSQAEEISAKTSELHTAYYIVGESKELQEANLIDKKGGLLGMGKTAKLSDNLDNSKFTRIDYTQVTVIPVNSKDMKIITSHPVDSYTIDKTGKTIDDIRITDPERFWSASKYLVITK